MTGLMFKSSEGFYAVLQCPRCKKVIFSNTIYKRGTDGTNYTCCECTEPLTRLDLATERVEIEL
jgi:phage FluMu protein Com